MNINQKAKICSLNSNGHILSSKSAFTIVELLVVIVVIGVLAAITIVSYTDISSKVVATALQSDLGNASKLLKMYYTEYGSYPVISQTTNCPIAPSIVDNKYCLKTSPGTTFVYSSNNSNATPTFNLLATNGTTNYTVTNSSQPSLVTLAYATGGTLTNDGRYRIHTFSTNGTLTVTTPGTAEVLVVGGGGGGATGGGGAGGYLEGMTTITNGNMSVVVGAGGLGINNALNTYAPGSKGENSSFSTFIAYGGGGGSGDWSCAAGFGGSGGGGGAQNCAGGLANPTGQGNTGGRTGNNVAPSYPAAGGGGAGEVGQNSVDIINGGNGGAGLHNDITGTNIGYAGGGGGNSKTGGTPGSATDGGGNGVISGNAPAGSSNSGGGGGGTGYYGFSGSGGSGIVIIRYLIP
jgi:prepilin-type N-terminal cleavage/methylation domain-containing protein